jgi:SUMO ligase MMS21 Smc5/6 complex component
VCDETVDALYKELNDFSLEYKTKQREMYDEQNGKGAGWREMKEYFDEQKVFKAQKFQIMKVRENADKEVQDLVKEIQKLNRQCHPTYNTLEDLEKG